MQVFGSNGMTLGAFPFKGSSNLNFILNGLPIADPNFSATTIKTSGNVDQFSTAAEFVQTALVSPNKVVISVTDKSGIPSIETYTVETFSLANEGASAGYRITQTTNNSTGAAVYQISDPQGNPVASGSSYSIAQNGTAVFEVGTSQQVYDLYTGRLIAQVDADGAGFVVGEGGNDTFYSSGQLNYNTNSGVLNANTGEKIKEYFATNNLVNVTTDTSTSTPSQSPTTDATSAVNATDDILIRNGDFTVTGMGNVNADGAGIAAANNTAAEFIPGDHQNVLDVFSQQPWDDPFFATNSMSAAQQGAATNSWAAGLAHLIPTDPLVLDLNGDGVKLSNYADAPILFDTDNDGGSLEQTGWVSPQDGIVVHDLNADGNINNISETLSEYYNGVAGSNGVAGTKPFVNGFGALKSLDSNNDNQFSNSDAAWNELRVWVDANHDGKTDGGELKTFSDLGITAINLNATAQSGEVRDGNAVLARGSFTQYGITQEAIAANFLADPAGSTIIQSGSGIIVTTENMVDGGGAAAAFVSQNTAAAVSEALSATTLGVKNITGGAGDDSLTGDAQNNWLAGGLGADSLNGGDGDDVLLFDANDTGINGGQGLDIAQVIGNQGVTLNLSQSNVEIAVGGDGNDVFIGGGRSTVFVRGGAGDDLILGGAANDVLSGEDGADLIDGGAGNDLIRGHRGQDQLLGGQGDDVLDGGLEDDSLSGGAGNDVLIGGRGDDSLNGGDGIDVAQYSGSYADYRITKIKDGVSGNTTFRVVDTRTGRDGADTLTGIEKLSFTDVSRVDLTLAAPMPVQDILRTNSSGQALSRTGAHLLSKIQLLQNDRDWDSDSSEISITEVIEAKGGTAALTAQGDVLFMPDASYAGVMSFKYKVQDAQGNYTRISSPTGQTDSMKAAIYLQTGDLPDDPLAVEQWYLSDTNVMAAWGTQAEQAAGQGYSGKGVRIGQFEPGGPFSTGPAVFDYRHPDLARNADKAWLNTLDANGNNNVPQTFSSHATMVAGVMVAARNGEGGVGVAYNASLEGQYFQGNGLEVGQLTTDVRNAVAKFKNFDVVNNSWGASTNFSINVLPLGLLANGIADAIQNGRNGLGTAIVMAGGNDRERGANTNYNALTANRAVVTVGSINAPGDLGTLQVGSKPFSNPGSSILVSAPGSNIDSTSRELTSDNGSTFGSEYSTSQGTSFAAPIVSGVIALMLEANPGLGYRDIQTILAMSATKVNDPNGTDWTYNGAKNWNGGGMHASHDYGFGMVDAKAAVRLAETWYDRSTSSNEQKKTAASGALNASINDGSGTLTQTLTMAAGLKVETAQVSLVIDHQRWGDMVIKLISPTGTESILVNRPGKTPGSGSADLGDATAGALSFSFNTTHIRGEDSGGSWTLQVIDAATGAIGTLKNWTLDLYGATADSNDVYVYTNEFTALTGRTTLTDLNGGDFDTINLSAVTSNSTINLTNGSTSMIAGRSLTISGDVERVYGGDGNDSLTGSFANNTLLGGRGADILSGDDGQDMLDGGRGNDTLTGGAGTDLFVTAKDPGSSDVITDFTLTPNASGATEAVALIGFTGLSFATLSRTQVDTDTRLDVGDGQTVWLRNVQAAQLTENHIQFFASSFELQQWQQSGQYNGGATEGANILLGTDADDVLYGLGGNDTLNGGVGADTLVGGTGLDQLDGGVGNDILVLDGDTGSVNYSTGVAAGGTRTGGAGNDRFVVAAGGGGSTTVGVTESSMTISNLVMDFNVAADRIDVSQFAWLTAFGQLTITKPLSLGGRFLTRATATNGTEVVSVGFYAVQPAALNASHFIFSGSPDATVVAPPVTSRTLAGPAPLIVIPYTSQPQTTSGEIQGTADGDTLTGNAGANTIIGLAGADNMTGRTGDDTYIIDNAGDTVHELPGGGYDSVQSSVSHTLSDNVEVLTLTGASNINATGNAQRNRLVGNAGSNRLDGGAEADSILGGAGSDIYVVEDQLDTAYENFNEGTDEVESSVSWTLGSNFENLTLTGNGNINATGNEVSNVLVGNSSDNIIDGAQGADAMTGGLGNDVYYVDNLADSTIEAVNEGIDSVYTSVNLTLANNVENGVLFGAASTLTGNNLDNTLVGNGLANTLSGEAGNDVLDGGVGADAMAGGAGDDVYFVDNAGDTVVEDSSGGIDTVITGLNYTLGVNTENLVLTGTSSLTGTGNSLDNQISGNSGDNTLSGGAGNDVLDGGAGGDAMTGGAGDDTYYLNAAGDTVVENAGEGSDTIVSALTYSLGANLENLTLSGFGNTNATGNGLGNILLGNSGTNILDGGAGADSLLGNAGSDVLRGDIGNDNYLFSLGDGQDTVEENDGAAGTDTLSFGPGIALASVTVSRLSQDLVLSYGASDSVTVKNWFAGNAQKIEQVSFADGGSWNVAQLYALANLAPVLASTIAAQAVNEDATWSFTVPANTFTDADTMIGDTLSYSASLADGSALPSWVTFDPLARTFSGTPLTTDVGTFGFKVIVTDSAGANVSGSFAVVVEKAVIVGTEAGDYLVGTSGNDRFEGGAGNDVLEGGAGNDVYLYKRGDGSDVISENDATAGNVDKVRFDSSVLVTDVKVTRYQNQLYL